MDWKPFPPKTPEKGKRVLLSGIYRPYDILPGGEETVIIATFSTLQGDGEGCHWMSADGWLPLENFNVDWKMWADVPYYGYSEN